eukprot:292751-Pelagomonas_calceolata.AAC.3
MRFCQPQNPDYSSLNRNQGFVCRHHHMDRGPKWDKAVHYRRWIYKSACERDRAPLPYIVNGVTMLMEEHARQGRAKGTFMS